MLKCRREGLTYSKKPELSAVFGSREVIQYLIKSRKVQRCGVGRRPISKNVRM